MADVRAYFKNRAGKYERFQGIRQGTYYYLDARLKKELLLIWDKDRSA